MLKTLMDHLLATDVLLGEQTTLPLVNGGAYSNIPANVFNFAGRVVDKLWQGESPTSLTRVMYGTGTRKARAHLVSRFIDR